MDKVIKRKEKIWNEMMKGGMSVKDVIAILNDMSLDDFYRDRAVEILLAYDFSKLSFRVNLEEERQIYNPVGFPEEKLVLAAEIIIRNIKAIKDGSTEKYFEEWETYNYTILSLIQKLGKEEGLKLFGCFEIADVRSAYKTVDDIKYRPLEMLLREKTIDYSFKNIAVEKMHRIIVDEHNGKIKPKSTLENAFKRYNDILAYFALGDKENIKVADVNFIEKEVKFLLGIDNHLSVIGPSILGLLMVNLSRETKKLLLKRQMDCKGYIFGVYFEGDEKQAQKLLKEFPEYEDQIQLEIDKYWKPIRKNKEATQQKQEKTQSFFLKMKKSQT